MLNHFARCVALWCDAPAVMYAAGTVALCGPCAARVAEHFGHAAIPSRMARERVATGQRPPAAKQLPTEVPSLVYYAEHRDRVKIGTTTNPRSRWTRLRALYGSAFGILVVEPGGLATELARHAQFVGQRCGMTEWFRREGDLAAHIDRLREERPDWQELARTVHEASKARATSKAARYGALHIPQASRE